jgi:Tol biopolymer transport system component/DNA-binding SARP family transcriptional activator
LGSSWKNSLRNADLAVLDFHLLGKISLRGAAGTELDALLRQPKRLALLAYLAAPAPGTWHRRDTLLALFWPDLDTPHARTSLRNALYMLRQSLGEGVLRSRGDEEISVDPDSLRTDLAEVWAALRNGKPEAALASCGGELLPGLFPQDSEGFQRWLDTERMRLKVAVSTAAVARVTELEKEGKLAEALAVARRIIEIEPDDETIVRRVMRIHDAMGDRAGALSAYEGYRSRLASDFGAEPAPETVALADRLRISTAAPTPRARTQAVNTGRLASPVSSVPELDDAPPIERTNDVAAKSRSRFLRAGAGVGATLVIAVVALIAWKVIRPPGPAAVGTSSPLTTEEGLQIEPAISPNGRLVAYASGNATRMRIFIQKVAGGSPWPLSGDSTAWELVPRWSPDNDEVLFLSRNGAFAAPAVGGSPRLIAAGTEGDGMVRSASWSPAGDSIAIVRNDSLIVQPLERSGSRFVGRGTQLHSCVWSPDGKWIACVSGNWLALAPGTLFGNEAPSSIELYPATGGSPIQLTDRNKEHRNPTWSADGKYLWILSNRDGISGEVYALPIGSDGRARGPFVRVGLEAESIGLSRQRIAYSVRVRRANIWAIPIPVDTPATLARATQITSGNQIIEIMRASHDGRWLVYDSNRSGNADIYRMPITGGRAERLTDDPGEEYAADLSPDGRELVWQMFVKGERHLFVKNLDGGSARELIPDRGDKGVARWSPDGNALAGWSHIKEQGAVFVIHRDARGRWHSPAWMLEDSQLPVWSPDGKTIAFVRFDGSIATIPADSGARRTIYAPRPGHSDPMATYLAWSGDRDIIWFLGHEPDGGSGIWSFSIRSGRPRLLVRIDAPTGKSNGPSFTSDGRRFFFTLDERFSNVRWAELVKR